MLHWRRQRLIERVLTGLFAVAAGVALVRAAAMGTRLRALDDVSSTAFASRARDADSFVSVTDVAFALVALAIIPCFIVWCWRAAKNQDVLGREPQRLGSGFAIGSWFIPLANFVMPVLVIQDLWRGSDASIPRGDPRWRIADRSWLVGWWWGLFVVPIVAFAGAPADRRDFDEAAARGANLVALFGMLSAAAAAVLAILVVRRLDARQLECRDSQRAAGVGRQARPTPEEAPLAAPTSGAGVGPQARPTPEEAPLAGPTSGAGVGRQVRPTPEEAPLAGPTSGAGEPL